MAEAVIDISSEVDQDSKVTAHIEKISGLEGILAEKRQEREDLLAANRSTTRVEKSIASLEGKLEAARGKLPEVRAKAESRILKARLSAMKDSVTQAQADLARFRAEAFSRVADPSLIAEEVVDMCGKVTRLRETRNALGGDAKLLVDQLRDFVLVNPTGVIRGEDVPPEKSYFVWYHEPSQTLIILEDSPRYAFVLSRLISAVGMQAAMQFVSVDYGKLRDGIKGGDLVFESGYKEGEDALEGQAVTMEWLIGNRERSEGTPKVKIQNVDSARAEELIAVINPEIPYEDTLPVDEIPGLSKQTIHWLKEGGIERLSQLMRMSGEAILSIPMIGEKRAHEILSSLWTRKRRNR